jgi:chromosome segregation ATPase
MTDQELSEIKKHAKNHGGSAELLLRLVTEIEGLKTELAESQEHRLGWAAEVGRMAAQRAELRAEVSRLETGAAFLRGNLKGIAEALQLQSAAYWEGGRKEIVMRIGETLGEEVLS